MRVTTYGTEMTNDKLVKLVKEKSFNYETDKTKLDNPEKLVSLMCDCFGMDRKAEEYLYMIAVDTKLKPIGIFEISHGTVNAALVSPREIFIRALLAGAVSIFITHNHPSGDTTPSKEDIAITEKIKEAGSIMNIPLMDHVIIGDNGNYYSFREHGYIK